MRSSSSMISMLLTMGLMTVACGKKEKKDPPQPANVGDLQMSSALMIKLPSSLEKAGGATTPSSQLRLADQKRSYEACSAISTIDHAISDARSTGSFLCHIEVEKLDFGKKYNVTFKNIEGGGTEDAQIWVDNSNPASINVYYCMDRKLAIKSTIDGYAGAGLIKGKMFMKFSDSSDGMTFSYAGVNEFDMTKAGSKMIKASSKGSTTFGNSTSDFLEYAEMNIVDSGVTSLLVSKGGTYSETNPSNNSPSTGSYDEQSAVFFNGTVGQALAKQGSGFSRATFDKDGYKVASTQATSDVIVDKAKLPAKLSSSFSPEEPSGWDCSTTETLVVDLEAADKTAAHDACEIAWPEYNCGGDGFAMGDYEE